MFKLILFITQIFYMSIMQIYTFISPNQSMFDKGNTIFSNANCKKMVK